MIKRTKKISKQEYNKLEFYYKNTINKKILLKDFNKLKNFKYKLINSNNKKINKYKNRYVIFEENYDRNKDLYKITDYFSEECRIKCIYETEKNSLLNLFQKIKIKFSKRNQKIK